MRHLPGDGPRRVAKPERIDLAAALEVLDDATADGGTGTPHASAPSEAGDHRASALELVHGVGDPTTHRRR